MNLTLHEVAHLVHAKMISSEFEDVALVKPEFDNTFDWARRPFVPLKGSVMVMISSRPLLKMEQ